MVAIEQGATATPVEPVQLALEGDLQVYDPSVIFDGGRFWIVSTGAKIEVRATTDLRKVERLGDALAGLPSWAADSVPDGQKFWSPDVAYFGGRFHLYYAIANSIDHEACIGHATSAAMGLVGSWTDDGAPLICSAVDDDWWAIDPSVLVEGDKASLLIGSSGTGLRLLELDTAGARTARAPTIVAARPDGGTLQASAITYHDGYYYVFGSFDICCKGADSTRSIRYGRSPTLLGPYTDRDGVPLLNGGGSVLLQGGARWKGPGSNDVIYREGQGYSFYFAYDADNGGKISLRLSTLEWSDDGWPRSAGP